MSWQLYSVDLAITLMNPADCVVYKVLACMSYSTGCQVVY